MLRFFPYILIFAAAAYFTESPFLAILAGLAWLIVFHWLFPLTEEVMVTNTFNPYYGQAGTLVDRSQLPWFRFATVKVKVDAHQREFYRWELEKPRGIRKGDLIVSPNNPDRSYCVCKVKGRKVSFGSSYGDWWSLADFTFKRSQAKTFQPGESVKMIGHDFWDIGIPQKRIPTERGESATVVRMDGDWVDLKDVVGQEFRLASWEVRLAYVPPVKATPAADDLRKEPTPRHAPSDYAPPKFTIVPRQRTVA